MTPWTCHVCEHLVPCARIGPEVSRRTAFSHRDQYMSCNHCKNAGGSRPDTSRGGSSSCFVAMIFCCVPVLLLLECFAYLSMPTIVIWLCRLTFAWGHWRECVVLWFANHAVADCGRFKAFKVELHCASQQWLNMCPGGLGLHVGTLAIKAKCFLCFVQSKQYTDQLAAKTKE